MRYLKEKEQLKLAHNYLEKKYTEDFNPLNYKNYYSQNSQMEFQILTNGSNDSDTGESNLDKVIFDFNTK